MTNRLHRRLVQMCEAILPATSTERLRRSVRASRQHRDRQLRLRREELWNRQAGKGDTICKLQPGVRMRLYFDSLLCRHIYLNQFETEERVFLNQFLRPGDVFVDVGANIGLFTLIAARLVGTAGMVYAFEPCANTFKRLQENVRLNHFRNVQCHQLALSHMSQTMELMASSEGLDGWNSFAEPYMGEKYASEPVAATTWDEWSCARQLTGRVTMMKIDVEGWEGKVLRGARTELARADAPLLQVEFTDAAAQAAGMSCRALYQELNTLGYEMCRFEASPGRLVPDAMRENYPYCNLFAVKRLQFIQDRLDASHKSAR